MASNSHCAVLLLQVGKGKQQHRVQQAAAVCTMQRGTAIHHLQLQSLPSPQQPSLLKEISTCFTCLTLKQLQQSRENMLQQDHLPELCHEGSIARGCAPHRQCLVLHFHTPAQAKVG
jgi:hypothetical protein